MTRVRTRRPGALSVAMIVASIGASIGLSLALDVTVLTGPLDFDAPPLALLFNAIAILQSAVGGLIEWRRPGHGIGRLLMLSGPLFAFLAVGWTIGGVLRNLIGPSAYAWMDLAVTILSYPAIAVMAGWLPLLFPTGTLPGPRWRVPVVVLFFASSLSLVALLTKPGQLSGAGVPNPIGLTGWPTVLQPLADALMVELIALLALAVAGLVVRYRRGDGIERQQIRWLLAAVSVVIVGFIGVAIETAIRTDDGIAVSIVVAFVGIFLMPIAIGVAVLRYRLYEIDRIVSRTIGWALVTGVLVAVFAVGVMAMQTLLSGFTQGQTLAVAASTLLAFALFQPVRRRVQRAVDRRFDRARYDGERTAADFAQRLRGDVGLDSLVAELDRTVEAAVRPSAVGVWLPVRGSR